MMEVSLLNVSLTALVLGVTVSVLKRMMGGRYKMPPGPPQRCIVGNTHNMDTQEMHKSLWDHKEKYGPLSSFKFVGQDFISVHTMEAIRDLFLTSEHKEALMDRPEMFISNYIVVDDVAMHSFSEHWQTLKCVAYGGIKSTIKDSKRVSDALNGEFECLKAAILEKGSDAFDPRDILSPSVINTVMMTLVGRRFEYDHKIFGLFDDYNSHASALFTPGARLCLTLMPGTRFLPFGVGSAFRRMKRTSNTIMKELVYDVAKQNESEPNDNDGVVYQLLRAMKEHPTLTHKSIEGIVHDWYNAGVLPVRAMLYSTLYIILHHKNVQDKIHHEIDDVLSDGTPRAEDQERMPYTEAVVLEALRLTTPVPGSVPRSSSRDMTVYGYRIPKGTVFTPNVWRVHHDEEVWSEPWTFKPERFLDENGAALPKTHPNIENMLSFGLGDRTCIAKAFSISRLFLYVVNILKSFEIYNDDVAPGSWLDPRHYTRDTVMYPPVFELLDDASIIAKCDLNFRVPQYHIGRQ